MCSAKITLPIYFLFDIHNNILMYMTTSCTIPRFRVYKLKWTEFNMYTRPPSTILHIEYVNYNVLIFADDDQWEKGIEYKYPKIWKANVRNGCYYMSFVIKVCLSLNLLTYTILMCCKRSLKYIQCLENADCIHVSEFFLLSRKRTKTDWKSYSHWIKQENFGPWTSNFLCC